MEKVKPQNYLTIQGWMLNLGCKNIQEVAAYALVYGFSQDNNSQFSGSISYIQEWLMCSRPTAIATMKSLEEKGLIKKEQYDVNGVKFNKYTALGGSKKNLLPVKEEDGGSKESLPNNNIIINNNPQLSKDNIPQGGERESEVVEVVEDDGFETAWVAYGRKGNKKAAKRYWKKLSLKDRKAIMEKIPLYLKANPDEQFRKDFSGFINPSYRRWEDKIVEKTQQRSKGSDIPDWMTPEGRKRQEQMDNLVEAIWNG